MKTSKKTRAQKKKDQMRLVVEVAKPVNLIAKHCREFNKATVEVDRKAVAKKNGHSNTKHRNKNRDW